MLLSFLHKYCLKPSYSLRRQLLLSFGSSALLSILAVATAACICAQLAREAVSGKSAELLQEQVMERLVHNSRDVAETFDHYIHNLEGSVQLVTEIVQERIVGYPEPGWEDDSYVPFVDRETRTNKYPLKSEPLRLDWDIERNINSGNLNEHVQENSEWALHMGSVSSLPSYFMQGSCDPSVKEPGALAYYENCTDSHNDVETGGYTRPTPTNKGLYQKAGDIGALLKPIFEAERDLTSVSVYFHNSGAGSVVRYPGVVNDALTFRTPYISEGCDWMREINPRNNKTFGTEDEIRQCRKAGSSVAPRDYNAMERRWCRHWALNPGIAWILPNSARRIPVMTLGQGIFDRRNGTFIGCASLFVSIDTIGEILDNSLVSQDYMDLSVIQYKDNKVFADTLAWEHTSQMVTDTGFISEDDLKQLRNGIDFESEWSPDEIAQQLENNVVFGEHSDIYTAYPLPLPPDEYDPDYEPTHLVIHRISNDVFQIREDMAIAIDKEVRRISILSVAFGIAGVLFVLVIVWYVSRGLTRPLLWIKRASWGIVNHAGDDSVDTFSMTDEDPVGSRRCVPVTEISELVRQFGVMIHSFSGDGASTLAQSELFEVHNLLTWQSDYQQLYSHSATRTMARKSMKNLRDAVSSDNSSLGEEKSGGDEEEKVEILDGQEAAVERNSVEENAKVPGANTAPVVPAPPKQNQGPNTSSGSTEYLRKGRLDQFGNEKIRIYRSSLFWWILVLIVAPLVLTNATICFLVTSQLVHGVKHWVLRVKQESLHLEVNALKALARSKSLQLEMSQNEVVKDLYLATRVAGWLVFGGIQRSNSFTHMETATQECSIYVPGDECPFFVDRAPCACEWNDLWGLPCTNVTYTDSRYLQNRSFWGQARDADSATGRRKKADSWGPPGVDDSPSTTLWWDDIDSVPGSWKNADASGYETTYDRLRVISAMAVVEIPLYNYANALDWHKHKHDLATFVAFDTDGMMTGYQGCEYGHATAAFFESDDENEAYKIAPELCPKGKFGYDPRCRDWYANGRELYDVEGRPVHITAPYQFADKDEFASSATSPLANPATGEYVGQVLLDFIPDNVSGGFNKLRDRIAFVITPDDGDTGRDTVVRPGEFKGWEAAAIGDVLFEYESSTSSNRQVFENDILKDMKNGERGEAFFERTNEDGVVEKMKLAFEPVNVRVLRPLDPSDFSRGAVSQTTLVYSVGIAYSEDAIQLPWKMIEEGVKSDLERLKTVYLAVVASVSILFILFACYVTIKVTVPMITLLSIVRTINTGKIEEDVPPLRGGSMEVQQVYNSFAKLHKIIRISNVSFFSGNLDFAYSFISDALKLFRKVGDEKAIGVACNNVGNVLHAIYNDARYVGECCSKFPGVCVVKAAHMNYDESVEIAENEFEVATHDESMAHYAQQLADRLFNRGLFLLLVANDGCAPLDARALALSDFRRARQLDIDVKDFWLEHKLLLKYSEEYFYRLLRRTLGLLDFYGDDELRAIWDAESLLEDADRFLFAAWDQPSAPLFRKINRTGRLQQLEGLAIKVELCKGRNIEAARLAIRMFTEDEFLIECCFMMASKALLTVIRDDDEWTGTWSPKVLSSFTTDLRRMLRTCRQTNLDVGKNLIFAFEISERWEGEALLEHINASCLKLYDDCTLKDDHIGVVAHTSQDDMNLPLCVKSENEGRQRMDLDLATTYTGDRYCPTFPYAVQMLVDSVASSESDSYIVLLTDGFSWDSRAHLALRDQLERMNRERETNIHVFILGMGIKEEVVKEQCKVVCSVSKKSIFAEIDQTNVETTFEEMGSVICGNMVRNVCSQGVIMEKF